MPSASSPTETQFLATCTDIFTAGTDTGSSSVSFGIMLMALHPEVMAKVQKELDEVVGRARLPSLEDRSKYVRPLFQVRDERSRKGKA